MRGRKSTYIAVQYSGVQYIIVYYYVSIVGYVLVVGLVFGCHIQAVARISYFINIPFLLLIVLWTALVSTTPFEAATLTFQQPKHSRAKSVSNTLVQKKQPSFVVLKMRGGSSAFDDTSLPTPTTIERHG